MLEIEYEDFGPEEISTIDQEADAADIVNGDGGEFEHSPEIENDQPGGEQPQSQLPDLPLADESTNPDSNECPIAPLSAEEKRWEAEAKHEQEIVNAKEEHFTLAVNRSNLEAELKELKASEKAALKNLKNLLRRGPLYETEKPTAIDQAVNGAGDRSAISLDDPNADQSWRLIPTTEVISGIKGMGDKKADAIVSIAPSLGDLEELRAKAGIAHKPFSSVLPKGIGQGMADEIEERILTAVAKVSLPS